MLLCRLLYSCSYFLKCIAVLAYVYSSTRLVIYVDIAYAIISTGMCSSSAFSLRAMDGIAKRLFAMLPVLKLRKEEKGHDNAMMRVRETMQMRWGVMLEESKSLVEEPVKGALFRCEIYTNVLFILLLQ